MSVKGLLTDRVIHKKMKEWSGKELLEKDSPNLFLRITSNNAAAWVYRYTWRGQQNRLGYGSYPALPIGLARSKRDADNLKRTQGINPSIDKKQASRRGVSFEGAAREYWQNHCQSLDKPSNWIAAMENHVFPKIGGKEVVVLTVDDLVPVMTPVWNTHNGKKIRGWVNKVIRNAHSGDKRIDKDLMDTVAARIGKQTMPKNNLAALPYEKLPDLWVTIPNDTPAGLSMKLVVLSGVREGAAIRADWSEIDFQKSVWKIPRDRCKGWETGFDVPITADIRGVFEAAGRLFGRTGAVFPSKTKSGFISNNTHRTWLRKNGWTDDTGKLVTAHGMRAALRTWGQEAFIGQKHDAAFEHILMHISGKGSEVQRAYARSGRFVERRELMEAWADFVRSVERGNRTQSEESKRHDRDMDHIIAVEEGRAMTGEEAAKWARYDGLERE
ncbi:MAG: tyrosine-type recombinase/integrase [Octadecabacter sp.]